jgi:hypothetical protein
MPKTIKISGFLTGIDEKGRLELMFMKFRENKDSFGTFELLSNIKHEGYSPLRKSGFIATPFKKTAYFDKDKSNIKADKLLQHNLILEVQIYTFKSETSFGWYIKLLSAIKE